jgi:CheY-like chemotaxis protein
MDSSEPQTVGRPATILLVEDDPSVAAITATWLRALHYEVIVSADGRAACDLVSQRKEPIDLLLTDVMLPGMRGPVLATAARNSHPGVAILYTSGYSPELVAEMFASDADGAPLLHKPYTSEQLASSVRHALARKAPRSQASDSTEPSEDGA